MSSLAIVNDTLKENNKELSNVSQTLTAMLAEDIKRRKEAERGRKDQEEKENEAKRKTRSRVAQATRRQPKTTGGDFMQGLLGDQLYGLASSALAGIFGGVGAISLAKVAGKGLRFGAASLALNSLAQTAIDNLFESIPPEELGITDTEKFKEDVKTGINTGSALKFFGVSTLASAGAAVGSAFGDDLANGLESWLGTNIINAPNPLSLFGIGPDSFPVDLENETVQAALGGAVGMIAASLLRIVARSLVGKLAILGIGAGALLFRKLGMSSLADLLDKYKGNMSGRLDEKGKTPKGTPKGPPKPPPLPDDVGKLPTAPDAPKLSTPKPPPSNAVKLSQATQDILAAVRRGDMLIEGLKFFGEGANARPQIFVPETGRYRFASNEELTKLAKNATDVVEDTSKVVKLAKGAVKVVGEALVPVGVGLDLYAGYTDEELKNMGISLGTRTGFAMVESIGAMNDILSNSINQGLNYVLGTDLKTDYDLQGEIRKKNIQSAQKIAELQGTLPLSTGQTINVNVDKSSHQTVSGSSDKKYLQGTGMSPVDLRYEKKYMSMRGFGVAIGQVH